jgi:hypothetical protein
VHFFSCHGFRHDIGYVIISCTFVINKTNSDSLLLKSVGYFSNARTNEAGVKIRFCGNAVLGERTAPNGAVTPTARGVVQRAACAADVGAFARLFDRWLTRMVDAPPENQVRWGDATTSKKYNPYGRQSGLGFQGVHHSTPVLTNGSEFFLGTMTHYNHAVFGWVETVHLQLNITLNNYLTTLTLPVRIHETPNDDAKCPYLSDAGYGCSDRCVIIRRLFLSLPLTCQSMDYARLRCAAGGVCDVQEGVDGR